MKITSFNIADVGYHYIGLRVLKSLPTTTKEAQGSAISKNVAKYTSDKALRLMLPAPKGDFTTIGEKICQELVHMDLAETSQRKGYSLTPVGEELLAMLNEGRHQELRRGMAELHLRTYDNLRQVLAVQLDGNCIWSPVEDRPA